MLQRPINFVKAMPVKSTITEQNQEPRRTEARVEFDSGEVII
jgi:hypothetical protein